MARGCVARNKASSCALSRTLTRAQQSRYCAIVASESASGHQWTNLLDFRFVCSLQPLLLTTHIPRDQAGAGETTESAGAELYAGAPAVADEADDDPRAGARCRQLVYVGARPGRSHSRDLPLPLRYALCRCVGAESEWARTRQGNAYFVCRAFAGLTRGLPSPFAGFVFGLGVNPEPDAEDGYTYAAQEVDGGQPREAVEKTVVADTSNNPSWTDRTARALKVWIWSLGRCCFCWCAWRLCIWLTQHGPAGAHIACRRCSYPCSL